MDKNNTKQLFIVAAKLLVICTIIAVIIAFVNNITKDRIQLNELNKTAQALTGVYGKEFADNSFSVSTDDEGNTLFVMADKSGGIIATCEAAKCELLDTITGIYVLKNSNQETQGYCVFASPMGFKDKINILVAVNPTLTVKTVKIVSLSDTSGIGTKVQENSYLSQFVDKSTVIGNVDTISGATKSSKPVIYAVDTALKQAALYLSSTGGNE